MEPIAGGAVALVRLTTLVAAAGEGEGEDATAVDGAVGIEDAMTLDVTFREYNMPVSWTVANGRV